MSAESWKIKFSEITDIRLLADLRNLLLAKQEKLEEIKRLQNEINDLQSTADDIDEEFERLMS